MLQTYSAAQPGTYDDRTQALDLGHFIAIAKRRAFYFAVPFVLLLITGLLIIAIQRPIYEAAGEILVQSPEIPTDLVEPTVTAAATERIQVIQQRLMARDSLLPIVEKFNLFPLQRQWMSGTQLLDLMRERAQISLVDVETMLTGKDGKPLPVRPRADRNSAVAFTVSFDYENPELAVKVANELLTSILNEDVRSRTNSATETTEFLAKEVKRLQGKLDDVNGQIFAIKQQSANPIHGDQKIPEQLKMQTDELAAMKADLIQKSSVYGDEHPAIHALKKRIAALEEEISGDTKPEEAAAPADKDIDALAEQQKSIGKELDDESKKLTAARLGEAMELNQQSEHLQVIEQPVLPQKPIKPNRLKLLAISFALAIIGGVFVVFVAEMLDQSIRNSRQLANVVDSRLLVAIPYIPTAGEIARRRRRIIYLWTFLVASLLAGIAAVYYIGMEVDFSWFDRSWIDSLTRLSK